MKYHHTMIRVRDLEQSLDFYCNKLGLVEVKRYQVEEGRFTLVFLAAPRDATQFESGNCPLIELTYNWDAEPAYGEARNFGHLAFEVDDIYTVCQQLIDSGVTINRPPRCGRMAFIRSPDLVSIELIQKNGALPVAEPWQSMPNVGHW